MDGERPLKTYTSTEKTMYLVGMAGQNVTYCVIGAALAYYLQFTLLIPAFVVSTIMALARVWDAFNDPMMGTIVDKTRTKWGKCRPYLLFAPIPIFAITVACFINFGFFDPEMGIFQGKNALVVLWAAVTYVLWGMAYTVGDIPLWGITALMTEDQRDRAKLLAYAQIAGGIGAGVTIIAIQPVALG
ncbi:MAG TPA: MFS transporter, partial [Clostridiales bacterium]|nr:MFS transporter [Clostridiales bacterium]